MNSKYSFLWLCLLLLLKFSAASSSEDETVLRDDSDEEIDDGNNDGNDEHDEGVIMHAPGYIDPANVDMIAIAHLNLIEALSDTLPPNYLQIFDHEQLTMLLQNTFCSRLIAKNSFDFFLNQIYNFIILDDIHNDFFEFLPVFQETSDINLLKLIPSMYLVKALAVRSQKKLLNLEVLLKSLKHSSPEFRNEIDPVYCLPHLLDFDSLSDSWEIFKRGAEFIPSGNSKYALTWYISTQLFLTNLQLKERTYNSDELVLLQSRIFGQIQQYFQYIGDSETGRLDYSGVSRIWTADSYPHIFGTLSPKSLGASGISVLDLADSFGIHDLLEAGAYKSLPSDQKIIFRMLFYISILNPDILERSILSDWIKRMYLDFELKDLSKSEIDLFVYALFLFDYSDEMAFIIETKRRNCLIRSKILRSLNSRQTIFDAFISNLSSESKKMKYLTIRAEAWSNLGKCLNLADEKMFMEMQRERVSQAALVAIAPPPLPDILAARSVQPTADPVHLTSDPNYIPPMKRTKRISRNKVVPVSHFDSHFLNPIHLAAMSLARTNEQRSTYELPFPDQQYVERRLDNLMHHLNSADLGESAWYSRLEALDEETRSQEIAHEETLISFFMEATFAIHKMSLDANYDKVNIKIIDHTGFGIGLKGETMNLYARVIILPCFKVFFYDPALQGFLPYPLLHPDTMALLGYVYGWCIEYDTLVNWHLAPEYLNFLFYEEDPNEPMGDVIKRFFKPVFTNLSGLSGPGINPIDYFPTVFHSHQPLQLHPAEENLQLDLLSPSGTAGTAHASLEEYLSTERRELLEGDFNNKRPRYSSKAEEEAYELELKEKQLVQEKAKQDIVDVMLHITSEQMIDHLLWGRFKFQRNLRFFFNSFSQKHLSAHLFSKAIDEQSVDLTPEDFINDGFVYETQVHLENVLDVTIDSEPGVVLTPRQAFIRVIQGLSAKELKAFYWFVTGCTGFPISGLRANPIRVNIIATSCMLPTAATCFRTLKVFVYPTLEQNIQAMHKALTDCSGFFIIEGRAQAGISNGITLEANLAIALGVQPQNLEHEHEEEEEEELNEEEDEDEEEDEEHEDEEDQDAQNEELI